MDTVCLSYYWRLQIKYNDSMIHVTQDVRQGDRVWSEFNKENINELKLVIPPSNLTPTRGIILLRGHELYNFNMEIGVNMQSAHSELIALWLRGKPANKSVSHNIRILFNSIGQFTVDQHVFEFGREWDGCFIEGWKKGVCEKETVTGLFM